MDCVQISQDNTDQDDATQGDTTQDDTTQDDTDQVRWGLVESKEVCIGMSRLRMTRVVANDGKDLATKTEH